MIGIYCIKNKKNDKRYIGQSINIEKRWNQHRQRAYNSNCLQYNYPIYRAIRYYGIENFEFEILEECNKEELNLREQYWIKKFNTYKNGYNLTKGGDKAITSSKLNENDVKQIKGLLCNSDFSEQAIALMFNVTQKNISCINLGQSWYESNLKYPLMSNRPKKIFVCCKCGKEIEKGKNICGKCKREETRIVTRPKREELKKLVRNYSILSISKIFNVSDNAIRKWCKYENIPYNKKIINSYSDEEWLKI